MFSFRCLGCDTDLREGELVRIDGQRQVYDGYGGSAADPGQPGPCWHEFCYLRIPFAEKRDDDSPPCREQGFGYNRIQFLPGYDEDAPMTYFAFMDVMVQNRTQGEHSKLAQLYLVNNPRDPDGRTILRCQKSWERKREKAGERIGQICNPDFDKLYEDEKLMDRWCWYHAILCNAEVGDSPEDSVRNTLWASSAFRDLMRATRKMWKNRDAEDSPWGAYRQIHVFGRNYTKDAKELVGEIYESRRIQHPADHLGHGMTDDEFYEFWRSKPGEDDD